MPHTRADKVLALCLAAVFVTALLLVYLSLTS